MKLEGDELGDLTERVQPLLSKAVTLVPLKRLWRFGYLPTFTTPRGQHKPSFRSIVPTQFHGPDHGALAEV